MGDAMICGSTGIRSAFLTIAATALLLGAAEAEAATLRTIILSDDPTPGLSDGSTVSGLRDPVINDAGEVAFGASIFEASGAFRGGAIFNSAGPVAMTGDAVAGLPNGATLRSPSRPSINNAGEVVFNSGLQGAGVTAGNNLALVSTTRGVIVRTGDAAAGLPDGTALVNLPGSARINDAGEIAFRGIVSGPNVPRSAVIYVDDAPRFREGDPAPGADDGATLGTVLDPSLNNAGQVAFLTGLSGVGVTDDNNRGVVAGDALALRSGDILPGPLGDETFTGVGGGVDIDDAGQVVVGMALNGDIRAQGVFVGDEVVSRAGVAVPGPATGAPVGLRIAQGGFLGGLHVSENGVAAFTAFIDGPGVGFESDSGLFTYSDASGLQMLLREGDAFDVRGERQTLMSPMFGATPGAINAWGDIVFTAIFQNAQGRFLSGVFVLEAERPEPSATPVPLPAAAWALFGGLAFLGAIGRNGSRGRPGLA